MSLKDIFDNKSNALSNKTANLSSQEIGEEVESFDLVKNYITLSKKSINNVDWQNPSEFAKFGSAEKYYEDAIKNVYKTYPYDGSFAEKLQWEISSSQLTTYVFENIYPRNNGYVNIGYEYGTATTASGDYADTSVEEYIRFCGTLNVSDEAKNSQQHFELSNKLDPTKNRTFNLNIHGEAGITTEFYFKRDDLSGSNKQVILDIWNSSSFGNSDYGRFRVEVHPGIAGEEDKFYVELSSGSEGVFLAEIGSGLDFTGSWHHYAITAINDSSQLKMQLYIDGEKSQEIVTGSAIGQIGGAVQAYIGSLITEVSGTYGGRTWGKLSGSLDEFRFWKTKRSDKDIYRNYFLPVGAGVNTDDANTDLGVYYKFNEGICSTSPAVLKAYDKIVLDYSGRTSNGTWVGYRFGSRNTGSAIVESGVAEKEFKDPIVYPNQHQVLAVLSEYKEYGREYDLRNTNSLYNTLPDWIADEDSEKGYGVKNLMQMMAEFFDDLFLKIKALPTLQNNTYQTEQEISFTKKLLENVGFKTLEIFTDSTLLEEFLTRTETENNEERIYKIKNEIYKNIYNNIIKIYRSKGTSKSFRNLLHCFGVDENLVKINLYANDLEYSFDDRYKHSTIIKKALVFNDPDRFESTVYQKQDASNPNSIGYLPGAALLKNYGFTFEAGIIFPKKFQKESFLYFDFPYLTSSLFGVHQSSNGTWASTDNADIQVFAIRDELESNKTRFAISSSCLSVFVTSSLVKEVYENEKWNFALSLRQEKDFAYDTTGSTTTDYILELYGTNYIQDVRQNSVLLTASVSQAAAENYFTANKMIYAGAHRENYTGSVQQYTDINLFSVRYWNNYLDNETIDMHCKDQTSFGAKDPTGYRYAEVRNADTLALFWEFETVTGSDSGLYPLGSSNDNDAGFSVPDLSSGSLDLLYVDPISPYTKYQFDGRGDLFMRNETEIVKNQYLPNATRVLPESLTSDELTVIASRDDEIYKKDQVPVNHYFAIEKSMFQVISQDMLGWLGTVKDFNNLIGLPQYRYEQSYRNLNVLRQLFFRNVENEPDFDKFMEFYKWIDDAIYVAVLQIVPVSMDIVDDVFNIYESHILERNKYCHKLPTIEFKGSPPTAAVENIVAKHNRWKGTCYSKYNMAIENTENRSEISNIVRNEINRRNYLTYNMKLDFSPIVFEKKRVTEIIMNEVGFDLTGAGYYEIADLITVNKDCEE